MGAKPRVEQHDMSDNRHDYGHDDEVGNRAQRASSQSQQELVDNRNWLTIGKDKRGSSGNAQGAEGDDKVGDLAFSDDDAVDGSNHRTGNNREHTGKQHV